MHIIEKCKCGSDDIYIKGEVYMEREGSLWKERPYADQKVYCKGCYEIRYDIHWFELEYNTFVREHGWGIIENPEQLEYYLRVHKEFWFWGNHTLHTYEQDGKMYVWENCKGYCPITGAELNEDGENRGEEPYMWEDVAVMCKERGFEFPFRHRGI